MVRMQGVEQSKTRVDNGKRLEKMLIYFLGYS